METIESQVSAPAAPVESAPTQQQPVESQTANPGGEGAEVENPEQPKQQPDKSRTQRRIDELTRKFHESERARADLEARYAQEQRQRTFATQLSEIDASVPQPDQFSSLQEYGRALSEHAAKRATALATQTWQENAHQMAMQQAQAQQQAFEVQQRVHMENAVLEQRMADGVKKYPDFMEVVTSDDIGTVRNTPLFPMILQCDNAPDIAYALAKNPGQIERLLSLHPIAMAKAVYAMDAKFSGNTVTQAPPPPPQLNANASAPGGPPDPKNTAAWMKWREEQERSSRRRR